jgi:hypothetical protein
MSHTLKRLLQGNHIHTLDRRQHISLLQLDSHSYDVQRNEFQKELTSQHMKQLQE